MSCSRTWEAEASRDGRLTGAERASFERHLGTCAECKAEVSALAELAALARARPAVDELRAPRGRLRLIGAFNQELTDPPAPRRMWSPILVAAAIVVLAIGAQRVLSRSPQPSVRAEPEAPAAPREIATTTASAPPAIAPPVSVRPPPSRVATPDPDDDYRAALAKLDAGDDRGAAAAFERFSARYPKHGHAEDAAYLRVIALQHAGDQVATETAAADYLAAHPDGFRAKEIAKLAR